MKTALKPIWLGLLAAGLCSLFARADTIYLKNGRQIQATNTVRQNGKVTFETVGRYDERARIGR